MILPTDENFYKIKIRIFPAGNFMGAFFLEIFFLE